MISEKAETAMAESRAAKSRQDRKHPMRINVDDGRLVPNIGMLRDHPKYRVYTGSVTDTPEQRERWLSSAPGSGRRRVMASTVDEAPPFDIAKATKEELVKFAKSQYSKDLDVTAHHNTLRAQVRAMAEEADDLA